MSKQRDAYVRKMKQQIDDLNAEIDALEKKGQKASKELQAKYKEQIEKSRTAHKNLEMKMDEIEKVGEDAWEGLKDGVEHAWSAFTSSVNYFKSQFK